MDSNDIRSRLIEEELRSVWPGWHVARRLGGGSFGDVFQIYRDNYGIRVDSALKVIQMDDWMATVALPSNSRDEGKVPDTIKLWTFGTSLRALWNRCLSPLTNLGQVY